jgi:hypothetical protein
MNLLMFAFPAVPGIPDFFAVPAWVVLFTLLLDLSLLVLLGYFILIYFRAGQFGRAYASARIRHRQIVLEAGADGRLRLRQMIGNGLRLQSDPKEKGRDKRVFDATPGSKLATVDNTPIFLAYSKSYPTVNPKVLASIEAKHYTPQQVDSEIANLSTTDGGVREVFEDEGATFPLDLRKIALYIRSAVDPITLWAFGQEWREVGRAEAAKDYKKQGSDLMKYAMVFIMMCMGIGALYLILYHK